MTSASVFGGKLEPATRTLGLDATSVTGVRSLEGFTLSDEVKSVSLMAFVETLPMSVV
jgi:hypothetical protein